ncbi:hypothetical protein OO013_06415 [Mangrovivirga sp. M17]|uniref:Uncharacterized protein n=1 Tax=Mangrovivirga halotolerans TaxID=2993936 RepID=A0ABT3RPF6_9BACT|nr:hypothetical protein [Mangrovivirga halotolerans]MCX2743490.1 hypothetical protein [Mangrovivirga halotolerans]
MKLLKLVGLSVSLMLFFSCSQPETITPQPNDNNSFNEDARFVEGADTTTIKISETESFNLNNFLVSLEQLFPSEKKLEDRFEHIFDGKKVKRTILHESSFGEFNVYFGGYYFTYNSDSIITSFSYSKKWSSQSHFEVNNITYDKIGMIKNFELTFTETNNTYIYNFEFDENKYITSSSLTGYFTKNYFYNEDFEISKITRDDKSFIQFARSESKDILAIYYYNTDSVKYGEYQWQYENNRASNFYKTRIVNGEREIYEFNSYEYENDIFSNTLYKLSKQQQYYIDHTSKFTIDNKMLEYHEHRYDFIDGIQFTDYIFVHKYLNDQGEKIYKVKYYDITVEEENLKGYFVPTEFNGNKIIKGDLFDKLGNKLYRVNINHDFFSEHSYTIWPENGEGSVYLNDLPDWMRSILWLNREKEIPENYNGR